MIKTYFLIILTFSSLLVNGQEPKKDTIKASQFEQQWTDYSNRLASREAEIKVSLEKIATTDKTLIAIDKNVAALEEKIKNIENGNISLRYEAGGLIITQMTNGLNIISYVQMIAKLQDNLRKETSPWSYEPIKLTWDRINDYTFVAGALLATSMVFVDNENQKKIGLVAGINIAALPKLIGLLTKKNKKLENRLQKADTTIQFLTMSRRFFDDLAVMNYKLEEYIKVNESLSTKLESFETKYRAATTDEMKRKNLNELLDIISEYESTLKQIPGYLTDIESLQYQYIYTFPQFSDKFTALLEQTSVARKFYEKRILPILKVDKSKILNMI